jgi:DNA (cytosine-5)-methyltransferase 1
VAKAKKVISLFSGGMGLDLGFEAAGFEIPVSVEILKRCCETIRANRPGTHVFEGDIRTVTTAQMLSAAKLEVGEAFAVIGGPPCQSFSTGGKRTAIHDTRGELFMEFVRVVKEAEPAFFVFENVSQLLTAAVKHRPIAERPGQNWNLSAYSKAEGEKSDLFTEDTDEEETDDVKPLAANEMSGSAFQVVLKEFESLPYELSFGVLNAADFGVPQKRLRLVLIGSKRKGIYQLPEPTHTRATWKTLADALENLTETDPQHSNYSEEFKRFFSLIPPGGNWRALPIDEQRKALGNAFTSGGGKTGFFRRLAWDEPTPTIVGKPNRKSCAICHPEKLRPLTVRESARVQGFPDDWQFCGSMHDQYLQIGNAVPVGLGHAIATSLLLAAKRTTPKKVEDWETRKAAMHAAAMATMRVAATNNNGRKRPSTKKPKAKDNLPSLFS